MSCQVFISHASPDASYITPLVDLLKSHFSLSVDKGEILYTSLPETGLNNDVLFNDELRQAIHEAKIVIVVISKNYISREYSLCELGAIWAMNKTSFLFNHQNIQRNELPELSVGKKYDTFDSEGLDHLCDKMAELEFKPKDKSYSAWNSLKKRTLETIKKELEDNPIITTAKEQTGEYVPISDSVKQKLDAIKELPQIYRDACFAESLGLVFHPNGYSAYQRSKKTESGVNYYPVREGSLFVDSLGKTHNFLDVFTKIQNSNYKEKWWNAKRKIASIGLKNIIHYLGDTVEEVCKQTAANRLASITDTHFRDSILAIVAGLLDGYYGENWEKNISGTDEKYEMAGYCIAAAFYDSQGNVGCIESTGGNNEHTPFYGARETILICCHWGYEDYVLSLYQREVDKMRHLKETLPPARSQLASRKNTPMYAVKSKFGKPIPLTNQEKSPPGK